MRSTIKFLIAALFAGSFSLADAAVVEVWQCQLKDGKTADELRAASSAWLAAVKSMEGGAEVEAYHNFSVVAYNGENGFNFISITPPRVCDNSIIPFSYLIRLHQLPCNGIRLGFVSVGITWSEDNFGTQKELRLSISVLFSH